MPKNFEKVDKEGAVREYVSERSSKYWEFLTNLFDKYQLKFEYDKNVKLGKEKWIAFRKAFTDLFWAKEPRVKQRAMIDAGDLSEDQWNMLHNRAIEILKSKQLL